MAVFEARQAVSDLLDAWGAGNVSFALNATMALNIAIEGLLPAGGIAVTTAASHNSVLRPLNRARDERGCQVRVAAIRPMVRLTGNPTSERLSAQSGRGHACFQRDRRCVRHRAHGRLRP